MKCSYKQREIYIILYTISMYLCIYIDEPDIHYQPTHLMVIQNSSVIIPCEITIDEATVDYFWFFNDNRLNFSSPRYMMEQGTGNITITNVQDEDEGIYECLANLSLSDNMAGDVRFSVGSGMISVVCKLTICPHSRHVPMCFRNDHKICCVWLFLSTCPVSFLIYIIM